MKRITSVICGLCLCAPMIYGAQPPALAFDHVTIVTGDRASEVEGRMAQLLAERIAERSNLKPLLSRDAKDGDFRDGKLTIFLGCPARHALLAELLRLEKIKPPTETDPGDEGFLLHASKRGRGLRLLAAGVEERGVLYAVGEILRRMTDKNGRVDFPPDLDLRTAPAFRYRGMMVSQGHTIAELTKSRHWTEAELRRVILDYALAGANNFAVGDDRDHEFFKSYGLQTLISISPNGGSGPPEWEATEAIGRKGHLCLSVPEARAAILKATEAQFSRFKPFDFVRMYSGDGGGCECDQCAPYGGRYIRMAADLAAIIHHHHPQTKIFATNQKLDNAGDQAIFDYLNEQPRPWLTALAYGPGSNPMSWQPGRRQDHRMDLFRYPAFGAMDRYLREIIHQLPPRQSLVFYTDVTHWLYSEYGLVNYHPAPDLNGDTPPHWDAATYAKRPDPALALVYDRRTFFARPRHYYHVFRETMRYGDGDAVYSEGYHDQFNQWMWQRLLWSPNVTLDEALGEYTRTWFGPDAATTMAEALLQLEENLSTPLATNVGIDRYYSLVRKAGRQMPEPLREQSHLWRQHLEKSALDKYVQLRLRRQLQIQMDTEALFAKALRGDAKSLEAAIAQAQSRLNEEIETGEMKRLRAEADRWGKESEQLFGVRSEGLFNLDQDLVGLTWTRRQVQAAAETHDPQRRRELARLLAHYEDAGAGGFYDDAGDPARSPHLTHGWPYGGDEGVSSVNRPSQRTLAFTAEGQQGVTFEYHGLDAAAQYRVRFTLVRPTFLPRFAIRQPQKTESIFADGHCLARELELPEAEAKFFEFEIPREATRDGDLKISFEKSNGVGEGPRPQIKVWRNTGGWGTLVSEVWLMKAR